MDLLKTKIYLDKINREFVRMSKDPENIVRIDVDIMLSYVRELYDAVLTDVTPTVVLPKEPAPPRRQNIAKMPEPIEQDAPSPAPPPPPPPAPVTAVTTPREPVVTATPPVQPVVEQKPAPAPPSSPEPPAQQPKAAPHGGIPPEAEGLFEEKQAKELSDKLADLPIADLRRAIALNDRLLLTRELFASDGQTFEATINALNGFAQFEDAKIYLLENCVIRYGWLDKKRIDAAKNFIKLVRRRYK
ncbi:MAG: hypothetical protein NW218_08000 [Saprospiraceae bacterium]|nr:hypothetical protein [Saprospiraceae bacterium]